MKLDKSIFEGVVPIVIDRKRLSHPDQPSHINGGDDVCMFDGSGAVAYTKENVAAKALADQISDLSPPTQTAFGRLLGRIEEGKGEAYATKIDVRYSDRNRVIAEKRILIAIGGSATAEMAMKYSSFSLWLSKLWLALDESQQYGNYHEMPL